jgi:peptidyl-prolyl cis-trans isomerase A (cyclophilin A)
MVSNMNNIKRKTIRTLFIGITSLGILSATVSPAFAAGPQVVFKTSKGSFVVELDAEKAPKSVENFLNYVNSGFYSGTIFHRVINGFMIQGGGFTKELRQKATSAPIPLESRNGLKNLKYTIAMARTGDPNSATSQFFINVKNNPLLDYPGQDGHGYAVFGQVISGEDVIEQIKFAPTAVVNGMGDVPVNPVIIESATLKK